VPGRAGTYGFVNAKIRSKLSSLLSERDYTALMKKGSLEETIDALRSTPYRDELSTYMQTGDIKSVEFALYIHEINTVKMVHEILHGPAADFVEALLLRYEVDMVKNALRLWFDRAVRGRSIAGATEYLYQESLLHPPNFTALVNASGEEELRAALEGTPYYDLLSPKVAEIKEQQHLFHAELELDAFFYRTLGERTENLPEPDRRRAQKIIGVEIDIQNIDRIARFVSFFDVSERGQWDIVIPGGSIPREVLQEAYGKRDVEEALHVIFARSYTGYQQATAEEKRSPYARLQNIERLLYTILHDEVKRLLRGYPFTIGTVLAYVFLKRREIGSVIRILNAKYYGFSEEQIREVL